MLAFIFSFQLLTSNQRYSGAIIASNKKGAAKDATDYNAFNAAAHHGAL